MAQLITYRYYFKYKDKQGKLIDQDLEWPLDTYKIIQAYSVSEAIEEFKIKYPNHLSLGVAGTSDLTEDIISDLMKRQGHIPFEKLHYKK